MRLVKDANGRDTGYESYRRRTAPCRCYCWRPAAAGVRCEQDHSVVTRGTHRERDAHRRAADSGESSPPPAYCIPREEAAVGPEVAGYQVAEVLVEEGAQVSKGQPLARLNSELLRARIDQAQAGLAQSTAVAEQARAEAERVKNFDTKGAMSIEQIAARRYQARTADAAVGVARAQLDELLTQEQRLVVRAPVGGHRAGPQRASGRCGEPLPADVSYRPGRPDRTRRRGARGRTGRHCAG